jgi:hypothetical protein
MKTSVKTFKRGDKTITTVGVMHVGSEKYFNKIQKELDRDFHDVVLYEGVKGCGANNLKKIYEMFSDICQLKFQKECLDYSSDNWVHSDLNYDILLSADPKVEYSVFDKFEDGDTDDNMKELGSKFEEIKSNPKSIWIIRNFILLLLRLIKVFAFFRKANPVILNMRNYKIILDTFEQLKNDDVNNIALFYGQRHFIEIEKFLKSVGFEVVDKYKLNPIK